MHRRQDNMQHGFTIVEVVTSIVVLMIGILGASAFRYHASINERLTRAKVSATRIGMTVLETWHGMDADLTFDPATTLPASLAPETVLTGPAAPAGFTPITICHVSLDDTHYYVTLSYKERDPNLRVMSVVVGWRPEYDAGVISASDETIAFETFAIRAE
jgi:type II secretory pathway pseudopilin PulG